ncbi:telomerase Cajal body protein 1-like [Ruditapes philippinarum]|uniref:telomerase Cajal body protein 1-like n=1 Tax=Ruditapes philippinarum TaxID=129788 RepID=UPI00295ADB1E|nr:telomerase Cajal body protein 1-like [Ruditapes philippinarum]
MSDNSEILSNLEDNSSGNLNIIRTDMEKENASNSYEENSADNGVVQLGGSQSDQLQCDDCKPMDETKEVVDELVKVDIAPQENESAGLSLSEYKEATIRLLDEVTSNVNTIPETDSSTNTEIRAAASTSIDLTKSDSVEIVTIQSGSSAENSRSPPIDDGDVTVDLTNEGEDSKECAIESVTSMSSFDEHNCDEPVAKRLKLGTDPISIDLTEVKDNSNASSDVVIVPETEESAPSKDTDMESFLRLSVFEFKGPPRQLTGAWECFKDSENKNYLRGCKWSPDGTCILTNSNDNKLKLFNLPDELYYSGGENKIIDGLKPVLNMKEADTVYDFCWYPLMSSSQPETACLAVTSKDTPVHLYDAFTGDIRCSYRAYNHLDEVVAAHCVKFSSDGNKIYCGFNKMIRVFDVTRPGRDFESRPTFAKEGQRGIISCIDNSPTEQGLYAAGSYSRSIALYSEPAGSMVCMFEGQHGGVTEVKFSPDGTKLYSGGRKDNEIICWDMRNPGQILFSVLRTVITNQRIYFDITSDSKYLLSGSHDGTVLIWDTTSAPVQLNVHSDPVIQPVMAFEGHSDTVNGISLHPTLPVIATASGQRHFRSFNNDDDVIEIDETSTKIDNSLRLWWS